jgi:hypothetical protein
LFSAEADLLIASFALASTFDQVFECDLLNIRSPSMRKYSILGNIVANQVSGQAEHASVFAFQKTHYSDQILRERRRDVALNVQKRWKNK